MKNKLCIKKTSIKWEHVGRYSFFPVYNSDIEFMNKTKENQDILCSSTRPRNPAHHKLIMAIGKCIKNNLPEGHFLENQLPYDIIKAIMLDAGIVDYKINLDGTTRAEPKSISFENMNETDFEPISDIMFKTGAKILKIEEHEFRKNYMEYL